MYIYIYIYIYIYTFPGYVMELYLMILVSVKSFLHCHYSQIHPDLEWLYLLRSHLTVKWNLLTVSPG